MSTETEPFKNKEVVERRFIFAKDLADTASNIGRWALLLGAIQYARIHKPSIELSLAWLILNGIFSYYVAMLFVARFHLGLVRRNDPNKLRFVLGVALQLVLTLGCIYGVNHLTNAVVEAIAQRAG